MGGIVVGRASFLESQVGVMELPAARSYEDPTRSFTPSGVVTRIFPAPTACAVGWVLAAATAAEIGRTWAPLTGPKNLEKTSAGGFPRQRFNCILCRPAAELRAREGDRLIMDNLGLREDKVALRRFSVVRSIMKNSL